MFVIILYIYTKQTSNTHAKVCVCVCVWTSEWMYVLCKLLLKYLSALKHSQII